MSGKKKIVAIQMDPLDKINFVSDSSVLLALELQARGYEIFHYTPPNLSLIDNQIVAKGHYISLKEDGKDFFALIKADQLQLRNAVLVLVRQDPPFNMEYITSTYLLDLVSKNTLILNNPTAIRDYPEKLSVYEFAEYVPPSVISYDKEVLREFLFQHREAVIKPLYSFAGDAVKLIYERDDYEIIFDKYLYEYKQIVLQKFLPAIRNGDTRVIVVDGEVMGAMSRIPERGQILSNVARGAMATCTKLSDKEEKICETIAPILKANNLFIAGIDMIAGYLIEINITSPTALRQLNLLYSCEVEKQIVDKLEKKIEAFYKASIPRPLSL